ncbi:SufE family protein [Cerasicoccus maritimus]|uniref:SufE family protein n=1 Tax=Cerasicoccus maritimus TaxID=490089 RepID=UPI002852C20E|nr:SufE family protein [Cerasicoccus maritimus]
MTLEEKRDELVEDLSIIEDPQERFAYIIDNAKSQKPLADEFKNDAFRIEGCQSQLWLVPSFEDGKCYFETDSDAVITKGVAGLLTQLYSGYAPEEIIAIPPDFLAQVGVTQHLTPNRRNGLSNVWNKIKAFAEHCLKEV